jgi:hypothetical protein
VDLSVSANVVMDVEQAKAFLSAYRLVRDNAHSHVEEGSLTGPGWKHLELMTEEAEVNPSEDCHSTDELLALTLDQHGLEVMQELVRQMKEGRVMDRDALLAVADKMDTGGLEQAAAIVRQEADDAPTKRMVEVANVLRTLRYQSSVSLLEEKNQPRGVTGSWR